MIYDYECPKCKERDFELRTIAEGPSHELKCSKCGENMKLDLGLKSQSIRIPEHMQAGSDAISPTAIGNQMNRSRPSGKRRSNYAVGGI